MDKNRNARTALDWVPEGKKKKRYMLTEGNMKENGRKRKETARIQHMGRGNQTSARQIKMERTRSWPHSPRGDRELSQVY